MKFIMSIKSFSSFGKTTRINISGNFIVKRGWMDFLQIYNKKKARQNRAKKATLNLQIWSKKEQSSFEKPGQRHKSITTLLEAIADDDNVYNIQLLRTTQRVFFFCTGITQGLLVVVCGGCFVECLRES